jgi:hypothetical protein
LLPAVTRDGLHFEKLNDGLRHGQPERHIVPPFLIPTIVLQDKRLAYADRGLTAQCLVQVCDQVFSAFQANREP